MRGAGRAWLLAAVVLWAVPAWAQQGQQDAEPAPEGEAAEEAGDQPTDAEEAGDQPTEGEEAGDQPTEGEQPGEATTPARRQGRTASGRCVVAQDQDVLATPGHEQPRQPAGEGDEETPWEGTEDAEPPPEFLRTDQERIEDTRPPPSPEQVRALREMEAEVERFGNYGEAYRDTVISLLRREYLRQRRGRTQWYARQIREEEKLLDEARERAVRLFERFIRTYPDDPTYTPDAMFRLGELYFERSSIQFQEAYDKARETGEEVPLTPDFTPTVELYKRLVRKFPDYGRLDGVYYLIGYTLNEMGEADQARMAWLNLVCANHFDFDPDAVAVEPEQPSAEEQAQEELEQEHPALTMDEEAQAEGEDDDTFTNPYEGCQPVVEGARFLSETWFRIGEYHFDDYGDPNSLELAISAYGEILDDPEDRNYNLALYKVAWAYYRASRYPEAIEHFAKLVQWSDDERSRTGKAGSELRPEAIQYLGISFAYDDWNENQIPDPQEGMPAPIERIQNPDLLPQDRSWTPEVYFQLGQVLFDEAKYPSAIEAWNLALDRWPMHPRAPEIKNMIARAHQRHNEFEEAIEARADLSNYAEGGEWWNANVEHPAQQRQAEQLAENALIGTAIYYHQQAQQLRRQCVGQQNLQLCQQAEESYGLAASAYRKYLERYPNNPQAYELQYNLADALYWSGDYERAARQYAAVRDSNLDDAHLAEAARRVVESLKRIVERAQEEGRITIREDPPEPEGQPPMVCPIEMPELLQRLARARQLYIARVSEEQDTENVLEAYDFNNALLLYQYGYWNQARDRFVRIFEKRCKGPYADETGRVAWYNLNNMAVTLKDTAAVEHWSEAIKERACTFGATEESMAEVDCTDPKFEDDPRCVAERQITNIRFKRALDTFRRAERASGEEQRRLYELAATKLVRSVNEEPDHPEAPLALEMAATALERTSRFDSAAKLYQRIIDEVGPREANTPEQKKQLDAILANAYFRLAYNANRFFDFDRAVDNYRLLADSKRFEKSDQEAIQEKREDALINAAIILENLQRYDRAAEYFQRAADEVDDDELRRRAYYRLAEVAYKQKSYSKALRAMKEFIRRYEGRPGAGELVVQAYWRIAQIYDALNRERDYDNALQDVVRVFARSGQEPGSIAAEYAAHAAFILANEDTEDFEDFDIDPGRPANMEQYVQRITEQIEKGSREAKQEAEEFTPILDYRRPTWTIASFVQQGRIYEILARAVLNTPFVMPADMQRQLRGLDQFARDDIKFQVEDRIRQVLDAKVRPIECLGVARYALAARAARAGAIDNEYTRTAIDRLQAYGDERIAECIAEAQKQMSDLQAYRPGEFKRAPRGKNLEPDMDVGPPPLAGEGD